jgi:hypothetical protein
MLINGSCHCGNITFRLDWTPEPLEIPARACTCSFCLKRGGVWTSNPTGALEIRVRDLELLSRYTFGTRTAEFLVCAHCGAVPVVTSLINDHLYAVVSVNAFDNVDASMLRRTPASFEGESEAARLERRARNWISSVTLVSGAG